MIKQMICTAFTILIACYTPSLLASENAQNPPSGRLFNVTNIGNSLTINSTKPGWYYQFAGAKNLTSGFSFTNCTPTTSNGFCLFPISDTLAAIPILAGPAIQPQLKICLNGVGDAYSCERVQLGDRFGYVTNYNGAAGTTVSTCKINSVTGKLSACTTVGGFDGPEGIAINPEGTFAYVISETNFSVFRCPINTTTGGLDPCTSTGNGFFLPEFIAFNPTGTFAYITNEVIGGNGFVTVCPVNKTTGALGPCTNDTSDPLFAAQSGLSGIAINAAGTRAYIADENNQRMYVCPINNATGALGACAPTATTTTTFGHLEGVTFNADGNLAYIVDSGHSIINLCPVNMITGNLGTCINAANGFNTTNLSGNLAFNAQGTLAYIADAHGGLSVCTVTPSDGTLTGCVDSGGTGFSGPAGIALR